MSHTILPAGWTRTYVQRQQAWREQFYRDFPELAIAEQALAKPNLPMAAAALVTTPLATWADLILADNAALWASDRDQAGEMLKAWRDERDEA